MHQQHVWAERAVDPALPLWLRVAALAFAGQARNGHCHLATGDLEMALSAPDGTARDSGTARRALRLAVEHGFIAAGSNSRCLIVPPHAVSGGSHGSAHALCDRHR
jgi:hypothetical protein